MNNLKIAIIGSSGSGKSTLAQQLSKKLNIPAYHLDCLWWKPNWIESSRKEFDDKLEEIVSTDNWIIDGNYSRTFKIRFNSVNSIIYLNYRRYVCLWRAIKRNFLFRNKDRPDITNGCRERFDLEYIKFLKWIWDYPKRSRPRTLKILSQLAATKKIYIFHSPYQLDHYFSSMCAKYQ